MAAPAHVQAVSAQSVGAVGSLASPSFTSTGANLLAVIWGDSGAGTYGATPVSDSKSNTWTQFAARAMPSGSGCANAGYYAKNITGGSSHTVTLTATNTDFLCIAVEEVSGADTTAPLDQHPATATHNNTANPRSANSITPTQSNTLAVYGMSHAGSNNNTFADAGTGTVRTSQTSTTNEPIALATDTRTGTGAVTEGFNLTANDTINSAVVVANFVGTAAAAATFPLNRRRPDPWRPAQAFAALR